MCAHRLATTEPEEFNFLKKIFSKFSDPTARLVYGDWLEEQGDPTRATFVRDMVNTMEAFKGSDGAKPKLPSRKGLDKTWANMLGWALVESVIHHDAAAYLPNFCRLVQPVVIAESKSVANENRLPLGSTKLAGLPDLPAETQWPSCERGRLGFVGQLNLKDLGGTLALAKSKLPKQGLLSFFTYADCDGHPSMEGDMRVFYTPPRALLERKAAPEDLGNGDDPLGDFSRNIYRPPAKLTFMESLEMARPGDFLPKRYQKDLAAISNVKELWELTSRMAKKSEPLWLKRRGRFIARHLLLGFQGCCRCDDPSPGEDWLPIAAFGSDKTVSWNWCDGDQLTVYIHKDDIRDKSFRRSFGYAG